MDDLGERIAQRVPGGEPDEGRSGTRGIGVADLVGASGIAYGIKALQLPRGVVLVEHRRCNHLSSRSPCRDRRSGDCVEEGRANSSPGDVKQQRRVRVIRKILALASAC